MIKEKGTVWKIPVNDTGVRSANELTLGDIECLQTMMGNNLTIEKEHSGKEDSNYICYANDLDTENKMRAFIAKWTPIINAKAIEREVVRSV